MIRMLSVHFCLEDIILAMLTHETPKPFILILENIIPCHHDKLLYGLILESMSSCVYCYVIIAINPIR
jgi:hypothetical protein